MIKTISKSTLGYGFFFWIIRGFLNENVINYSVNLTLFAKPFMTEASNPTNKVTNLSAFEMADSFQTELSEVVTTIEAQIKLLQPFLDLIKNVNHLSNLSQFQ
jgi:hypothetical protein